MTRMIFVLAFIIIVSITPFVYSQSFITFDIDVESFTPGEIVELKGTVQAGLEGKPVAIEIKDAGGNVILIRTVTADENGEFVLKFKIPSTAQAGEFDIITNVEIDGQPFTETKTVEASIPESQDEPTMELKDEKRAMELERETMTTEMQEKSGNSEGGGCLIATATYGTELAPQVQQLRELRDNSLLPTNSGSAFMTGFNQLYYSFSPTIADWERENSIFKETVKLAITPLLSSLSILNYIEIDSEEQVLGYGISVILLNIGMYFVAPVVIITKIRNNFRKMIK